MVDLKILEEITTIGKTMETKAIIPIDSIPIGQRANCVTNRGYTNQNPTANAVSVNPNYNIKN